MKKWHLLSPKFEISGDNAVDGLDVSVLQDSLLGPVLGIPRSPVR